jgi:UDP-hydrolysing UDP-N-acetyl-D-glucosamine 2-epimerase
MRIAVVSGGRADFGLLLEPIRHLAAQPDFDVRVVLTGQHLLPGYGEARALLARQGLAEPLLVDMGLGDADDAASITRASGRALLGFADALAALRPDLMLVLGDRYEIVCAALAATLARIPIAHIAGGDLTAGAIDDAFRHAITAMAHLHFATNADAARRLRQLGQPAERIHVIGSPGLDLALRTPRLARDAFLAAVGLGGGRPAVLVTFHPVTRSEDSTGQVAELLAALDALGPAAAILITGTNADPEGLTIDRLLDEFARGRPNVVRVASLGPERYFSALAHMDIVVGNSSSGLYEAPSFAIPTVNIGRRQDGRLRARSVIDCAPERAAIAHAIHSGLARGRQPVQNPYGDGDASRRLVAVLAGVNPRQLLDKDFRDLEA